MFCWGLRFSVRGIVEPDKSRCVDLVPTYPHRRALVRVIPSTATQLHWSGAVGASLLPIHFPPAGHPDQR